MSNRSRETIIQATLDALEGKEKDFRRVLGPVKNVFDSKKNIDAIAKEYNHYYNETTWEKTLIELIRSHNSQRNILETQMEQMKSLFQFLNLLKKEFQEGLLNYQRILDNMLVSGLPDEIYQKFQIEHLDQVNSVINSILELIDSNSIPFIKENISKIQELIDYNK
ncbi:MAG: hypothetical protein JXR48_17780 [Candidatus Delongbacteria bacterium]|nr:hypothetical protein [Candidatus Delongbacteria bacterium]MBN2836809.1 hypothetical protein [Candidatus Delongbacteria bacterium]